MGNLSSAKLARLKRQLERRERMDRERPGIHIVEIGIGIDPDDWAAEHDAQRAAGRAQLEDLRARWQAGERWTGCRCVEVPYKHDWQARLAEDGEDARANAL